MKIAEVHVGILSVPLRTPFVTALRRVEKIEDAVVEIVTDTGEKGYGEAPPTAVITGDTLGGILEALRDYIGPKLIGREVGALEENLKTVQGALKHNTSAKAAAEMALYDLYGQFLKTPVYRLLGSAREEITTDLTISVGDPAQMAADALDAKARGFDTLKLKVGIDPSLDVERLSAVRQAVGKDIRIRIDANQAWKSREAVEILSRMQEKDLDIELVEQPVKAEDLDGLKYVTENSPVPVLADESVFSAEDALKILQLHAADLINIKLMKCGGISGALKIATLAEMYGVECMIGCMLESKVAVNAAVHLAMGRSVITKVDLDGPGLCAVDPILGGSQFDGRTIRVSQAPGLGITGFEDGCFRYV